MRLIDADKLECVSATMPKDASEDYKEGYSDGMNYVLDIIDDLPTIESVKWIPVSERLPGENADILVTYVNGQETRIIPVNYGRGTWFDCIFNAELDPLKITAWMPLPEPWKGEVG